MSNKNIKGKTTSKSQSINEIKEPEPVIEVKQTQKGGKKTSKQIDQIPVVEKNVEPIQKGGKKITKQTEQQQMNQQTEQISKGDKKSSKKLEQVVEPKVEVEMNELGEEQGNKFRYFKLFYNDEYQGRFRGRKPKQAANKAFSSIIKDMKKSGNQKGGVNVDINFSIRECTRNSKHKEYNYVGVREQLKDPVEVVIKNDDGSVKEITYSFHNKISKSPKVQA